MIYARLPTTIQDEPSMTENNSQTPNAKSIPQTNDISILTRFHEIVVLLEDKSSSLFIFSEENLIRKAVRAIINSTTFEYIILATILANCFVMAMEEHLSHKDKTPLTEMLDKTELYFLVIFSTETFLKIIAQGFILHAGSYMRNVWNSMDFFVVTTGLVYTLYWFRIITFKGNPLLSIISALPFGPNNLNFKVLKSIRALRPLKLISGVPNEIVNEGDNPVPCTSNYTNLDGSPPGFSCEVFDDSTCLENWDGPNDGITSFDNIGLAMLTVFQCITMEGWTSIMYWMNDAVNPNWNWLYFVPLIVIGSFFMLNLVLGVLSGEFAREREKVENRQAFLKLRRDQLIEREFDGYIDWICKAEELILAEERTSDETKKHIVEARRRAERKKLTKLGKSTETEDDDEEEDDEEYADYVFLSLFVMEMVVKMYAIGIRKHFKSAFNRFDCIVISGSLFEMIWLFGIEDSYGLSVLRALRLLRIFKVTSYWSSLRNLVISLLNSMKSIISLLLLLFLFIFIFGLLGMQLFGGKFNFPDKRPDAHFDTFTPALLTVFQILTGEDWNEVMYNGIRSHGGVGGIGMLYSLYFIILTLFGNYTLLNVFLAIAVDNLASAQELTAAEEEQKEADKEKQWRELQKEIENLKSGDESKIIELTKQQEAFKHIEKEESAKDDDETGPKEMLPYSSMFFLSPTNPVRRGAHWIVNMKYFDFFIMFVIGLSSIALAAEDPVVEDSDINLVLNKVDYGFTAVFAVEMVLKVIDLGIICHPKSYLRDIWNVMDSVVVICAIVSMALEANSDTGKKSAAAQKLSTMKSLRVLRVLRPLKTIKRIPKLKAVFDCVVNSLKNVVNILVVYMLFNFIFAVIGVKLYNGKFHYCTDESKKNQIDCNGYFFVYEGEPTRITTMEKRIWKVQNFHYDNVLAAMLTLYAVQSTEGWPVVLKASMDSFQKGQAPVPNYRIDMSIYYIVYFIIFPFFFVNIFVALIIVTFQEQGEAELQEGGIDKNQKSCIDFAINARPSERYIPENQETYQYKVWKFVVSPVVDNFILLLIVLNTVTLMMKFHGQSELYKEVMHCINLVFTVLFTIETVLKIIGFGPRKFFKDSWNVFDLVTVVGSLIDAVVSSIEMWSVSDESDTKAKGVTAVISSKLAFLRLFRAARLVKLMRRGATIRVLLWTFVQSFKALPYVCLLIAMLFFIYAVVGMQVTLKPSLELNTKIQFYQLSDVRCATGEAWPNIMMDCRQKRTCEHQPKVIETTEMSVTTETSVTAETGETCGSQLSTLYFVSFIFFCSFLMLNLFVAVIMDNFDYLTRDSSILGAHNLDEFIRVWTEYDPCASGKISHKKMYEALRNIPPPLGFGKQCPSRLAYKKLIRMNMPVDSDGNVNFTTTLFALIRENLGIHMRAAEEMDQADEELRRTITHMWPLQGPKMADLLVPPRETLNGKNMTVGKIYGGLLILESWRSSRFGQTSSGLQIFNVHKTHNDEHQPDDDHLHPNSVNLQNRRTSMRPPHSRSPSPGMLEAAANVVDFIKDERYYRSRRGFPHSRYAKGTSSASTSPEPSPNRLYNQDGNGKMYGRRPPLRRWRRGATTSSAGYSMAHNTYQNHTEAYEEDCNVLSGRSRTPSPGKRFGNRFINWTNISSSKANNGRKLPPTPKQPSTLQIPIKSTMNFPRLDASPSTLVTHQPAPQTLTDRLNNKYNSFNRTPYEDIERELYEQERDVDSEFDYKNNEEPVTVQGPLSFEEALLLSRPIRSTSVVWNGFKTSVVGYSPDDSKLDEDEWC
ncbi:hypothetical protein HA402_007137 [Bradysia odoriphaga]|nr:hypothetical protein HA402_007137 [Bradysia odoriphaga]